MSIETNVITLSAVVTFPITVILYAFAGYICLQVVDTFVSVSNRMESYYKNQEIKKKERIKEENEREDERIIKEKNKRDNAMRNKNKSYAVSRF
jgi:hypothetical protein